MKAELRDDATQLVDARQGGMRTQLDPTSNPTQASTPNDARSEVDSMLVELGISHEGATPRERREAIRVFQQARHLPETGVVDTGTRRELEDSLRMRQSMLRNAAAAGEGGPIGDAAATLREAQALAMARFAAAAKALSNV